MVGFGIRMEHVTLTSSYPEGASFPRLDLDTEPPRNAPVKLWNAPLSIVSPTSHHAVQIFLTLEGQEPDLASLFEVGRTPLEGHTLFL